MSSRIHSTALVDPGAELGDGVEIGPYVVIDAGVRLGEGCRVAAHAVLTGDTEIGAGTSLGYGCVIGSEPQDFAFDPSTRSSVRIGRENVLREYVTIHRGTKPGSVTEVGDGNFLMTGTHLGHNTKVGSRTIIANNCLMAGYVEIGDSAVLGGGTVFHQFIRVGKFSMVRGGTRFGKDIPPFAAADGENLLSGINSIGLRRNGFSPEARRQLRAAFKAIFRSGRNISQALDAVSGEAWGAEAAEFFAFIRASKRGVCAANQRRGGPVSDGDELSAE